MCTALVSVLTDNPTLPDMAMTGEITLQGRILAIGGLKEKILAAKQHGITKIIIPQENFDDIEEIKKEVCLDGFEIILVKNMDDVLTAAFCENPFEKAKIKEAKKIRKAKQKKNKKSTT
jgi:ATP-dependent Lon protease